MIYYLNNNFRNSNNFKFNGHTIIQTLGGKITSENTNDIIYLVGDKTSKINSYNNIKIYIFRDDNKEIEMIHSNTNEMSNPKIMLLSLNNSNFNTILFSYDIESIQVEKGVVCLIYLDNHFVEKFNSSTYNFPKLDNIKAYLEKMNLKQINIGKKNSRKDKKYNYIQDFRLTYDCNKEIYSLLLIRKNKHHITEELELEYINNEFIITSSNLIL